MAYTITVSDGRFDDLNLMYVFQRLENIYNRRKTAANDAGISKSGLIQYLGLYKLTKIIQYLNQLQALSIITWREEGDNIVFSIVMARIYSADEAWEIVLALALSGDAAKINDYPAAFSKAAKGAGGIPRIANCEMQDLVWANKEFKAAYSKEVGKGG